MPELISQRMADVVNVADERALRALLRAILTDLTAIRTLLNTHVHSGVTAGAANTGVPTVLASALELRA